MYTLACILFVVGGFCVFLGMLGSISEEEGAVTLGAIGYLLIGIALVIGMIMGA